MSAQIDTATASMLFDTEVTMQYQNSMQLGGTIEERHGTTGEALNVPVSDTIEMSESTFAPVNVPITAINETNIMVIPNDAKVKSVLGGGYNTLFNYPKLATQAKLHAKAGGRWEDFIKIDAIFSHPSVASIEVIDVATGVNTGINQGKMSAALGYLEDQSVDVMNNNVSMWAPAIAKQGMMNDDRIVNFFYNTTKPLVNNQIQSYLDVDCRFLGSNGINTIPYTDIGGGIRQYLVPMVAYDTMVQMFNRDFSTSITWVAQEDRWEILSTITTGANIIQLNGICFMEVNVAYAANP